MARAGVISHHCLVLGERYHNPVPRSPLPSFTVIVCARAHLSQVVTCAIYLSGLQFSGC